MNSSNAYRFLPLVEALAAGKTLQLRLNGGEWMDLNPNEHISFEGAPERYRVKREPQLVYLVRRVSDWEHADFFLSREAAEQKLSECSVPYELVTFTENL